MMVVCKPGQEEANKKSCLKARQEKLAYQQEQTFAAVKLQQRQQIEQEKIVADKKGKQR